MGARSGHRPCALLWVWSRQQMGLDLRRQRVSACSDAGERVCVGRDSGARSKKTA